MLYLEQQNVKVFVCFYVQTSFLGIEDKMSIFNGRGFFKASNMFSWKSSLTGQQQAL